MNDFAEGPMLSSASLVLPNGQTIYGSEQAIHTVRELVYPMPLSGQRVAPMMSRLEACGFALNGEGRFTGYLQHFQMLLQSVSREL